MSNQIGERYTCLDPSCGCEIEVLHPCAMLPAEPRQTSPRQASIRRSVTSPELSTPPSEVAIPRVGSGIQEGAGERTGAYGSPRIEDETRGPFREEEGVEDVSPATGRTSTAGFTIGNLTCFCGSPMKLSESRSSAARAGGAL